MSSLKCQWFLVVSAASALFVGCGGSDDVDTSAIAAECNLLFRCAAVEENYRAYDRLYYGTESACVRSQADQDIAEDYRVFIEDGTVVFDESAASRCNAAIRATCTYTAEQEHACESIFVGQVPAGGGCLEDVQCVSGVCTSSGFDECGSCRGLIPTGEACSFILEDLCARGPNGEYGYCNGDVCEIADESDRPTGDAGLGMDCDFYDQHCEPGLFCVGGTCARWRQVGESCDPEADSCTRGAFCVESEESPGEGTCFPVRIESRPGEDCGTLETEVVACDLAADLYCNDEPTGVCALFSADGEVGEFCVFTAECLEGLTCRSNYCLGEPAEEGAVCRSNAQCQSANCERSNTFPFDGICQPALFCL